MGRENDCLIYPACQGAKLSRPLFYPQLAAVCESLHILFFGV